MSRPAISEILDSVLSRIVEEWAAEDPDKICIVQDDGLEVTYRDLDTRASAIASEFRERGVSSGDRVLTLVPNDVRAVYLMLALNKLGAVEVPINPSLVGDSLRHVVRDAAPVKICASSCVKQRTRKRPCSAPFSS